MDKNILATHQTTKKIILRVMLVGIIANIVLVAFKLGASIIFDNLAVMSDAAHSATDLITSLAIVIVVLFSSPKRDKKHNYGHEKIEPLALLFFALLIAGVGILLVWQGIEGILSPKATELNWFLLSVTIASIIVKEALFWYGIYYAKKLKSEILRADAWHSRSDGLASVAVLIGLICSLFLETDIAESIAVLLVSLLIFKVAFSIFRPAIKQLTDTAASEEAYLKIKEITQKIEGVLSIDTLHTRIFGNKIYVEIVIEINAEITALSAHKIMLSVHDTLEANEDLQIKHCSVGMIVKIEDTAITDESANCNISNAQDDEAL